MKILLVGGGSGGHITPLLAVARKLKQRQPDAHICYVLERGNGFLPLVKANKDIDELRTIFAGKFRRYHGESFMRHLLDIPTILKNIRDFFKLLIGLVQGFFFILLHRPNIVFIKGGFVGVPIGLACALLRVPYLTHDSDTVPGLANKIIGKWAKLHATGMPEEFYGYPNQKMRYVGIPLASDYQPVFAEQQAKYRRSIGVPHDATMICVTGGSLGAVRLNDAFVAVAEQLLSAHPKLYIFHQTGKQQADLYKKLPNQLQQRVIERQFVDNLYAYMGAADLIIARAGATTIAEIGALKKACVLIPNPVLTGGQQPKNASHLLKHRAVVVVSEAAASQHSVFFDAINNLLDDEKQRYQLADNLNQMVKLNAAEEIAETIIMLAKG